MLRISSNPSRLTCAIQRSHQQAPGTVMTTTNMLERHTPGQGMLHFFLIPSLREGIDFSTPPPTPAQPILRKH